MKKRYLILIVTGSLILSYFILKWTGIENPSIDIHIGVLLGFILAMLRPKAAIK